MDLQRTVEKAVPSTDKIWTGVGEEMQTCNSNRGRTSMMQVISHKSFVRIGLVFLLLQMASLADAQIPKVEPKFRTVPIWYWQEPSGICVPVPSYDIISRIAPERIRKSSKPNEKLPCEIRLGERQLVAFLICHGDTLEKYFSIEEMCQAVQKKGKSAKRH